MPDRVLVLGADQSRLTRIGGYVKGQTSYTPMDGSVFVERHDPPKNWFDAGEYVLLIVDLEFLGGSAMNMMMIEDHCAAIGLPVLVLTDTEYQPWIVFGKGGPYRRGGPPNPPWRIVCRTAEMGQELQKFTVWKASQISD